VHFVDRACLGHCSGLHISGEKWCEGSVEEQDKVKHTRSSSCALLWCQPRLVYVLWKSRDYHLKEMRRERRGKAAKGARAYLRFQPNNRQDF